MTVSVLFLVGRFLFAVPFVVLGVDRLADGTARERAGAIVGLVAAAGIVLGAWGDVAALVLALQIVATRLLTGRDRDADAVLTAIGLVGGAVVVAACYAAVGTALDLTITDPVLDLDLR